VAYQSTHFECFQLLGSMNLCVLFLGTPHFHGRTEDELKKQTEVLLRCAGIPASKQHHISRRDASEVATVSQRFRDYIKTQILCVYEHGSAPSTGSKKWKTQNKVISCGIVDGLMRIVTLLAPEPVLRIQIANIAVFLSETHCRRKSFQNTLPERNAFRSFPSAQRALHA
jgi:hypothetical protein